jgi:hypothetical protein
MAKRQPTLEAECRPKSSAGHVSWRSERRRERRGTRQVDEVRLNAELTADCLLGHYNDRDLEGVLIYGVWGP